MTRAIKLIPRRCRNNLSNQGHPIEQRQSISWQFGDLQTGKKSFRIRLNDKEKQFLHILLVKRWEPGLEMQPSGKVAQKI